jgi:transposase-like protein
MNYTPLYFSFRINCLNSLTKSFATAFLSWKDRKAVANDLKTVYCATTEEDAQTALLEFDESWGKKYPHITQSWTNNWNQLATFFKYPKSVQTLIYTTNPIESLNSSILNFGKKILMYALEQDSAMSKLSANYALTRSESAKLKVNLQKK